MAGYDPRDGDVFVEFFPAQGEAVQAQCYLFKLFLGSLRQNAETIGREADDTAIGGRAKGTFLKN